MKVISARLSEIGTINGAKGDQTKKEVCISAYKDFGQTKTIRFNDSTKAKKLVQIAKKIANCEKIGYGQADRNTAFLEFKKIAWDISRIGEVKKCNLDCSMLIAIAINCLYKKPKMSKYTCTYNMERLVKSVILKDITISNLKKDKKVGDIELKAGKHVVIIAEK